MKSFDGRELKRIRAFSSVIFILFGKLIKMVEKLLWEFSPLLIIAFIIFIIFLIMHVGYTKKHGNDTCGIAMTTLDNNSRSAMILLVAGRDSEDHQESIKDYKDASSIMTTALDTVFSGDGISRHGVPVGCSNLPDFQISIFDARALSMRVQADAHDCVNARLSREDVTHEEELHIENIETKNWDYWSMYNTRKNYKKALEVFDRACGGSKP